MECGNSGAPEPSSQRKRLANAMQVSRDVRERSDATFGGRRAAACHGASVGHGGLLAALPGGQRSLILEVAPMIY